MSRDLEQVCQPGLRQPDRRAQCLHPLAECIVELPIRSLRHEASPFCATHRVPPCNAVANDKGAKAWLPQPPPRSRVCRACIPLGSTPVEDLVELPGGAILSSFLSLADMYYVGYRVCWQNAGLFPGLASTRQWVGTSCPMLPAMLPENLTDLH